METTYKPHSYAQPISLPQIPASASLSATSGGSGFQQWFRGLSSTPVAHFSPEAIQIVEERWKVKWEYYNQTFREEAEQAALDDMPRRELYKHVERLEAEFERLRSRFMEIDSAKASAEVTTGVQFVLSLIEAQTPEIYQIKATELNESQDNEQLKALRQQVKAIDRVHKFALQSSDAVHRIKVLELLGSRTKKTTEGRLDSGDLEKGSRSSTEIASPSGAASPVQSASDLPTNKGNQKVQFMDPEISGLSGGDNLYPPSGSSNIPGSGEPYSVPGNMTAMASSRYQSNPPVGSPGRQARPQRRGNSYEVPAPAPTQALSTAESHRSNLVSLSAISFFGAGMAWATVFSGTRGDLVFISWAACCFIVGAVSAASATSLLDADGELLNRYKSVRWTVRLLAVWSTVNVFVGVMLVSAAILVLDPNASQPSARMEGEAEFTVRDGRVAGGYSLVVCAVVVSIALIVRHRYSRRTWFV